MTLEMAGFAQVPLNQPHSFPVFLQILHWYKIARVFVPKSGAYLSKLKNLTYEEPDQIWTLKFFS